MNILDQLNDAKMYFVSGLIILFVAVFCAVLMIRAYRVGKKIGMDKNVLKRTMISSATFTILPSISILLGIIGLSGTLGIPLPWLRLSVIGALHYETTVADAAARTLGMDGLNISQMTVQAFSTIALLMGAGISIGAIASLFFTKGYLKKLNYGVNSKKKSGKSFGDKAMSAMFIGLVSAYIGSYLSTWVHKANILPFFVLIISGICMSIFMYFIDKKGQKWLENFSIAGSMLVAMILAVVIGSLL